MSLLLQALQKAAKSREDGEGEAASADTFSADELKLEPLTVEPSLRDEMPRAAPAPTPAQAATVMRASRAAAFDPIDYAREHYMIVFVAAATLFALGYGGYVYVQVSNPGLFRSQPRPAAPAAPLATAAAPAAQPPAQQAAAAPVSGMPAVDPVAAGAPAAANAPLPSVFDEPAAAEPAVSATRPVKTTRARATATRASRPVTATAPMQNAEAAESPEVETVIIQRSAPSDIAVNRQPATQWPVDPLLLQAYEALQLGDRARARNLYEQVLQAEPRSIDALLGLGAIAWRDGRAEEAGQYYQRVLELEPRNAFAQAGLISIIGGADPQSAESRLRQLIARDPSAFLYFTLGNLYADQNQWPGAQQAYFQAYQLQPDNPDYAFNLAVGLDHLGQTGPALEYYRKALDLSFRKGRANFDQNLVIQRVGQLSARGE
jgi:Flp pilus assembly protein TadD